MGNTEQRSKRKAMKRYGAAFAVCMGFVMAFMPMEARAAEKFDPAFYAATYADVVQALGTDSKVMYDHYLNYGQKEGRMAYPGAKGGEEVDGIADTVAAVPAQADESGLVPLDQLPHLKSLKKKCTDEEFSAAYDAALGVVTPLVNLSKEDQLYKIA